jgi:hypothetical protein
MLTAMTHMRRRNQMVTKTCVKAYKRGTKVLIDEYTYEGTLDSTGKDTLAFWMGATEWLNPFCSFEIHKEKDGIGESFKLGIPPEGDLL